MDKSNSVFVGTTKKGYDDMEIDSILKCICGSEFWTSSETILWLELQIRLLMNDMDVH